MLTMDQRAEVLAKRQQLLDDCCAVAGLTPDEFWLTYAIFPFTWNAEGEALSWAVIRIASLRQLHARKPGEGCEFGGFASSLFPEDCERQDILIHRYL